MTTVAIKVMGLIRKRGVVLAVVSAVIAVLAAKAGLSGHSGGGGGIQQFGFWDGPA